MSISKINYKGQFQKSTLFFKIFKISLICVPKFESTKLNRMSISNFKTIISTMNTYSNSILSKTN